MSTPSEAAAQVQPTVQITQATPANEKPLFINSTSNDDNDKDKDDDDDDDDDFSSANQPNNFDAISTQPKAQESMQMTPIPNTGSDLENRSSYSLSEVGSGYEEGTNECADFCIDCCSCFGLFDDCCPSDGEGCLTSTATFIGNLMFAFCRCK